MAFLQGTSYQRKVVTKKVVTKDKWQFLMHCRVWSVVHAMLLFGRGSQWHQTKPGFCTHSVPGKLSLIMIQLYSTYQISLNQIAVCFLSFLGLRCLWLESHVGMQDVEHNSPYLLVSSQVNVLDSEWSSSQEKWARLTHDSFGEKKNLWSLFSSQSVGINLNFFDDVVKLDLNIKISNLEYRHIKAICIYIIVSWEFWIMFLCN